MSNLKTDEDDDFITSASPETEPDEADFAFDAKEKKKKRSSIYVHAFLFLQQSGLYPFFLNTRRVTIFMIILKAMSLMIHLLILP